jgi:drug/metabolite transporter (DMT)-like permease
VVTWSALGGAVAAGIVAGVFLVVRNSQKNDFEKYNSLYAGEGDPTVRATDDSKRRAAIDDLKQSGWIAIGCGIGAGALAVTALVTYLLNPSAAESKTSVSLSPFGVGVSF